MTNENKWRLCNLATELSLVIASTIFEHRNEHKIICMIPGKTTGNKIAHIL